MTSQQQDHHYEQDDDDGFDSFLDDILDDGDGGQGSASSLLLTDDIEPLVEPCSRRLDGGTSSGATGKNRHMSPIPAAAATTATEGARRRQHKEPTHAGNTPLHARSESSQSPANEPSPVADRLSMAQAKPKTQRSSPESKIPTPKVHYRSSRSDKVTTTSSRRLTVPQGPRLHPSRVNKQDVNQEDPYSMAQAEDVLRKGLRSSPDALLATNVRSPTSTTVPHAPQLHQPRVNRRDISREDPYSMAQADDVLRNGLRSSPKANANATASSVTKRSPSKITVPQAPRFHHSHRERNKDLLSKEDSVSMAQSVDLLKKGLRNSSDKSVSSPRSPTTKTIPRAPVFHSIHERPLPKSRDELEIELMQQSTSFKASPMPNFSSNSQEPESSTLSKASPTKAQPFHFHSEDRAAHYRKPEPTIDKETLDLEECKKKFKARPMPEEFRRQQQDDDDDTSILSFSKSTVSFRPDEAFAKPFKARPVPSSTYSLPEHHDLTSSLSSLATTRIDTADLTATLQDTDRLFHIDSQHHHYNGPHSVASMQSRMRIEEYKRQKEEKRRQAQEEERKLREFRARPLPKSIQQQVQHRNENGGADCQHNQKHDDKEESFEFRARPLPKSMAVQLQQRSANSVQCSSRHGEGGEDRLFVRARQLSETSNKQAELHRDFGEVPDDESNGQHYLEEQNELQQIEISQPALILNSLASREWIQSPDRSKDRAVNEENMAANGGNMEATTNLRDVHDISVPVLQQRFEQMEQMQASATKVTSSKETKGSSDASYVNKNVTSLAVSRDAPCEPKQAASFCGSTEPIAFSFGSVKVFLWLCLFRVINTVFIQSHFEADEFWQTLEPAYCAAFSPGDDCTGLTWEWKRRSHINIESFGDFIVKSMLGPVRSYLSIMPTYFLYCVARLAGVDSPWLVSRGPMFLNAVTLAATTDWCVWYTSRWLQMEMKSSRKVPISRWCLFCSMVSWFNAYTLVRTLSNSQEACSLAIAIALVSPELIGNQKESHAAARAAVAFFIGGLSTSIRFTAVTAFIPMGIIVANRQMTLVRQLGYLVCPCALFGAMGVGGAAFVDRIFYGFWTIPFLGNIHFNVLLGNSSLYGTHSWHWYLTAGLPAVAGLLFPLLLGDFCGRGSSSYGRRNLWMIALCYLLALSLSGHKEFRFLLPILPLVCLLVGSRIGLLVTGSTGRASRLRRVSLISLFIATNLVVTLYLGLLHQSAPISVNRRIVEMARSASGSQKTAYSIYYWTGGCHTTPLHSHLHLPPVRFDTWSLDCSPTCLADPHTLCESERFAADPQAFVEKALCALVEEAEGVCEANEHGIEVCNGMAAAYDACHPVPDFVVTRSSYEKAIRGRLERAGLREVERFVDSVQGVRVVDRVFGQDGFSDARFKRVHPLRIFDILSGGWLGKLIGWDLKGTDGQHQCAALDSVEFSLDELILYSGV